MKVLIVIPKILLKYIEEYCHFFLNSRPVLLSQYYIVIYNCHYATDVITK